MYGHNSLLQLVPRNQNSSVQIAISGDYRPLFLYVTALLDEQYLYNLSHQETKITLMCHKTTSLLRGRTLDRNQLKHF